ncbi:hypothetical protein AUI46_03655 [archaeon 13_1_40CM_2_52_13]|nr:MAG: hypothetical protein AUI46_03655 [archaeon 13_1_40CM_2_52_13]
MDTAGSTFNGGLSATAHARAGGRGDTTFLSQNNWKHAEWNVLRVGNGSQANFNAGFSLTITAPAGIYLTTRGSVARTAATQAKPTI